MVGFGGHTPDDLTQGGYNDPANFQLGGTGPKQGVVGHETDHTIYDDGSGHEYSFDNGGKGTDTIGTVGPGSAQIQNEYYQGQASAARNRSALTADYGAGDAAVSQGQAARQGQMDALSMIRNRAAGGGASAAALGAAQANDQTAASQLSAIAGGRAGDAGALQRAVGAGSMQQGQNVANSGNARTAEIGGAQNALFGGYTGARGQDLTGMRMGDARSQQNANLQFGQNELNQNMGLGYEGLGQQVRSDQANANLFGLNFANHHQATQIGVDQASQGNANQAQGTVVSGASAGLGGILSHYTATPQQNSDERVKSGVLFEGIHNIRGGR